MQIEDWGQGIRQEGQKWGAGEVRERAGEEREMAEAEGEEEEEDRGSGEEESKDGGLDEGDGEEGYMHVCVCVCVRACMHIHI